MAAIVATMVISCSFAVLLVTPTADAAMAELNTGDKWALAGEKDLTLDFESINALFSIGNWEEDWYRNATITEAYLHGATASAAVFEVIDVTADQYVIKVTGTQNLSLALAFMMSGDLVEEGEYITDWDYMSTNPLGLKNISEAETFNALFGAEGNLAMAMSETIVLTVNKVNMTISEMDVNAKLYARAHIVLNNYPNDTTPIDNYTNDYTSINITEYISCISDISLDLDLTGEMTFEPYLQVLADSVAEGDSWDSECFMNGTLNWTGTLNAIGLPEELTDMLFGDEAAEWGVTGFPIDLAKIYNPGSSGPQIDNGTLEFNETISPEYYNYENKTITDPVYGSIFVNVFGYDDFLTWTYCPSNGAIVAMSIMREVGPVNIKLDMTSVPIAEAEELMDTIDGQIEHKTAYDDLAPKATTSSGITIGLELLVILVVIASVVCILVGFFVGSKKRLKP